MLYPRLVSRSRRTELQLPAEVVDAALRAAAPSGDHVADIVQGAVVHAVRLALAGQGHRLPRRASRSAATKGPQRRVAYVESRERAAEAVAVLKQAGSSVRAVAIAALGAYVDAGGDRLRYVMPGEARVAGAA